jgi:integrase
MADLFKIYWHDKKAIDGSNIGYFFAKYKDGEVWKSKSIPVNIRNKEEAAVWFRAWNANRVAFSVNPLNSQIKVVRTLRNLAPQWLEYKRGKVTPDFIRQAKTAIDKWILPYSIADLDLEKEGANPEPFMEWFGLIKLATSERTKKKLSAYYLRGVFTVAKLLIRDSMDNRWIATPRNPFDFTQVKKERPKAVTRLGNDKIRFYKDEIAKLLTCHDAPIYRRIRYLFAFATGFRDMEIQGMQWKDLKTNDGVPVAHVKKQLEKAGRFPLIELGMSDPLPKVKNALVRPCKADSSRKMPIHPELGKALAWWKESGWRAYVGREPQPEDPIFPTPNGEFATPRSSEFLRLDLLKAKLSDKYDDEYPYDFHSTRRTFATLLDKESKNQACVKHLMGHSADGVTARHYLGDDLPSLWEEVCKLPLPKWVDICSETRLALVVNE